MMQNGPYEIRGDYSLFENPGRLSSQFVSCRITLGDRHLIRSYIEGFFQCTPSRRLFVYKSKASLQAIKLTLYANYLDDNDHIDDILTSDGFDPDIVRLLQHQTPEQIRIETIQNVM